MMKQMMKQKTGGTQSNDGDDPNIEDFFGFSPEIEETKTYSYRKEQPKIDYWSTPEHEGERVKFISEVWPLAPSWYLRSIVGNDDGRMSHYRDKNGRMIYGPYKIWPYPWAPGVMEEQPEEKVKQLKGLFARMGAKSVLRDWLVERLPQDHTYVEPFCGSMKVLLWKKKRSKIEIVNDADRFLINFWRNVSFFPNELAEAVNSMPTSEYLFRKFDKEIQKMGSFMQAVAFYYLARLSFNGIIRDGNSVYAGSPFTMPSHSCSKTDFMEVRDRLRGVDIRSTSFEKIIKTSNKSVDGGVFFYLDPPYWKTTGYMTATEKLKFGWDEHKKLHELCVEIDKTGNKFLQTNSNEEDLKELYSDFYLYDKEVYYSVSGNSESRKETKELIITNFELLENKKQVGLFG